MPSTLITAALDALQPIQRPEDARQDALRFAASLTVAKGQAIGIRTSTGLAEPLVPGATNGTQNFVGFSMYAFTTDGSGNVLYNGSTVGWLNTNHATSPVWIAGIFDPADLTTKATPVAEVDTFTPGGTITTGDVDTLTYTAPDGTVTAVSFTVAGTTTAAAVSAGLIAAWNANATTAAVATATGSSTVILTATTAGTPFTVASSVTGVGTLTRAATTPASGRAIADVLVGAPGARVLHNGFWKI
jgi:hypothetical protein